MASDMKQWLIVPMALAVASMAAAQVTPQETGQKGWHVDAVSGVFSGGTWAQTRTDLGEPVKVTTDEGWLIGVRAGQDTEFLGWEASVAGVFADMDVKAAPQVLGVDSAEDSGLVLLDVNGLWYPFGDNLGDGRIKPYGSIGPGLAYFTSDYSDVDNELMFDVNLGFGVKFLLGDQGNPVIRADYRWYAMYGSDDDMRNRIYRQALTLGIGWNF